MLIIEDLLSALLDCNGEYMMVGEGLDVFSGVEKNDISTRQFELAEGSIAQFVKPIVKVAKYHRKVEAFTQVFSRLGFGQVNHALCSGVKALLKEYYILIAQVEHQLRGNPEFSVHKLWFYFQPTLKTMKVLHEISLEISGRLNVGEESSVKMIILPESAKGGSILDLLERNMVRQSGDFETKQTYSFLLSYASVPYISMLYSWIHNGEIKDRFGEFMIEERVLGLKNEPKAKHHEQYWERRYAIRPAHTPFFLEPLKDKILLAGKFLNVARECNAEVKTLEPLVGIQEVVESGQFNTNIYIAAIERAAGHANRTLLDLLFKKNKLISRLRSLKRYYFLDQSAFLTHFFDLSFDELSKPREAISQPNIKFLFELSLRNHFSNTLHDPYKENIKVSLKEFSLVDHLLKLDVVNSEVNILPFYQENPTFPAQREIINQFEAQVKDKTMNQPLTGFEVLAVEYVVPFPLSLVLSKDVLSKYQLIFRHIITIKHAETRLVQAWVAHTTFRKRHPKVRVHWDTSFNSFRMRLLQLIQAVHYYVCFGVLEPNQRKLESSLKSVKTVDEVFSLHYKFLDNCLNETMLSIPKLHSLFNKLLYLCNNFSDYCRSTLTSERNKIINGKSIDNGHRILEYLERHELILMYYVKMFVFYLKFYAGAGIPSFACLATQLDYNNFYQGQRFA
ncbi:gamma tubulin complex Spc97/GCP2 subunit Alp4, variant 3 [Entomophthora muscae]|nr:gamma tubulin complex Spc97/GCP2 subunit Alp4, variant 3 [Entomophthora muscae]